MAEWIERPAGAWKWWGLSAALFAAVVCLGCGGGGPTRYDVSGTVTFGGKPVPAGSITFEPDAAKGNQGPAGFAKIKNGKFDTSADGKGTIGGPHVVKIAGLSGQGTDDLTPEGTPLFPEYQTSLDLPKKASTQDFEVPATAAGQGAAGRPGGPGRLPEP